MDVTWRYLIGNIIGISSRKTPLKYTCSMACILCRQFTVERSWPISISRIFITLSFELRCTGKNSSHIANMAGIPLYENIVVFMDITQLVSRCDTLPSKENAKHCLHGTHCPLKEDAQSEDPAKGLNRPNTLYMFWTLDVSVQPTYLRPKEMERSGYFNRYYSSRDQVRERIDWIDTSSLKKSIWVTSDDEIEEFEHWASSTGIPTRTITSLLGWYPIVTNCQWRSIHT